tara:strand:- start:402 stop:992 length:591 start_codon:yes stop_codon:yes gene_type:complete
MFRATELSGFGANNDPGALSPDSTFWNGDQLSSFTITAGTINRNTTNDTQRRWVYTDAFGGDFDISFLHNGTYGTTEQVSYGWFLSSDLGSFNDVEDYGLPSRTANSQSVRTKDAANTSQIAENATDQSNDFASPDGTKVAFNRTGSVITILVDDSLHDTSALTTTADVRFFYGSYSATADGDGIENIQIISDTGT